MTGPAPRENPMSFLRASEVVARELIIKGGYEKHASLVDRAQRRAEVLGLDLNAVVEVDAERLEAFPTAECLTPPEVTAYCAGENLSDPARAEHAESCDFCVRILRAAQPSDEQRERFLDELGSLAERAISSSEAAEAPG